MNISIENRILFEDAIANASSLNDQQRKAMFAKQGPGGIASRSSGAASTHAADGSVAADQSGIGPGKPIATTAEWEQWKRSLPMNRDGGHFTNDGFFSKMGQFFPNPNYTAKSKNPTAPTLTPSGRVGIPEGPNGPSPRTESPDVAVAAAPARTGTPDVTATTKPVITIKPTPTPEVAVAGDALEQAKKKMNDLARPGNYTYYTAPVWSQAAGAPKL